MKRLFDIICAAIGGILLAPLFIFISLWIKIDSSGPIFFRQTRVGLGGKLFSIHKFRTMRVDSEKFGRLTIGTDSRITRAGKFLRRYKLDELPQLIDVLQGNMSLVGPRPEVPEYIECYPQEIRTQVLSVRPGITDNASLEMMDENELLARYEDPRVAYIEIILPLKQRYYLEYVKKHSLWNDFIIIIKTILKIINPVLRKS
jgi:Sugar transferases involved in lipopolysaccharide synthesis